MAAVSHGMLGKGWDIHPDHVKTMMHWTTQRGVHPALS